MMNTKYVINGADVSIVTLNEDTVLDALPPRVYTVQFNKMTGFYLTRTKDLLSVPSKVYGDIQSRVTKCITTYVQRKGSTGILSTGDKGTGKTLLTASLANTAITQLKLPVILITEPYSGEQFTSFLTLIGECCLVFDEFGKMYSNRDNGNSDKPDQNSLLSLFDGVDKTKRMILLTENNIHSVSEFILNRPGRIFYHFKYSKLEEDSIVAYCKDQKLITTVIDEIIEIARTSTIFSFDMLQSIVEEHSRLGGKVLDSAKDLNIMIGNSETTKMMIMSVDYNGRACTLIPPATYSKPIHGYVDIDIKDDRDTLDREDAEPNFGISDNDDDTIEISLSNSHLVYESNFNLVYKTRGYTVIAKELATTVMNHQYSF